MWLLPEVVCGPGVRKKEQVAKRTAPARSHLASAYSSNLPNAAANPFLTCAEGG